MAKIGRKQEPKYRIIEYPYWKALIEAAPVLSGSQYGILLKIADETFGYRESRKPKSLSCQVSHIEFQEATKLERRQVIRAIQAVEKRHIISADRSNGTRGTVYTWNSPETWQMRRSTSDTKDTSTSDTGGIKLVTLPRLQLTHKGKKGNKSKVDSSGYGSIKPSPTLSNGDKPSGVNPEGENPVNGRISDSLTDDTSEPIKKVEPLKLNIMATLKAKRAKQEANGNPLTENKPKPVEWWKDDTPTKNIQTIDTKALVDKFITLMADREDIEADYLAEELDYQPDTPEVYRILESNKTYFRYDEDMNNWYLTNAGKARAKELSVIV